jgi:translation initiation factor IF-2
VAKKRLYEIARELDLESRDVLERALELGLEVKTASSGLEEDDAALLALSFQEASEQAAPVPSKPEPKTAAAVDSEPTPATATETPEPEKTDEPEELPAPVADEPDQIPGGAVLTIESGATSAQFAEKVGRSVGEVVKTLLLMGEMGAGNAPISDEALVLLGEQFGYEVEIEEAAVAEAAAVGPKPKRVFEDDPADLVARPPVVTVMGHVDHGKTTLLDRIRKTNVVAGEAGGITQHIGAYQIERAGKKITFIDTPGHEAFTAMRARGAEVTDIVILVVAADDGIMPQTIEAISHAKVADVNIIVAINKIDMPMADSMRVRAQLTEYGLVPESLGGDTIAVDVSAATGAGIDQLIEMIDLIAELEEFTANPKPRASGVVIESQLDKGRGPVATVIVRRGTLRRGDVLVSGPVAGRVRAMLDENGKQLKEATPSTPVLVMGWDDVPTAGDLFDVMESEKEARASAADAEGRSRSEEFVVPSATERLTQLLERMRSADEAELRLIIKADANGSMEAIRDAISKIAREGGRITTIQASVGGITENDVSLAEVTEAVIVGFNVRPDGNARRTAEAKGIEVRTYRVIYELLDEIEQMLVGRLAPDEVEAVLGAAEVRAMFKVPRAGTVAGCYVTEGDILRNARARLVRQGVVVYEGRIASLRRFKDDVRSVAAGFECGIGLENFNDVKEGDIIEAFELKEVARQ